MNGLTELGYLGLFIASFISATVLPLASEAILGAMVLGPYSLVLCILIATLGNWLGGITTYYLGKLGNWLWIEKYLGVKKTRVIKLKIYMDKYGSYAAILSWVPIIGDLLALALGLFKVRAVPVFIFMLLGKLARYVIVGVALVYGLK